MTSHTVILTQPQAETLRGLLADRGFTFVEKPHTLFAAKHDNPKLSVSVYTKGPKVLVQGKTTEHFVTSVLGSEILGEATLGRAEEHFPDRYTPHLGIDESGKGDFLGPLVIAGVYTDEAITRSLVAAGVADSKRITSDNRIRTLAESVRSTPGIAHHTIVLEPQRYNDLYTGFGNVNRLLACGHAATIEALLAKKPSCPRALSDQFTDPAVLQSALGEKGQAIRLEQRTKAESDPAVAAASILAREAFIDWLRDKAITLDLPTPLPRGVSPKVIETTRALTATHGPDILKKIAKTHFTTTRQIIP
ncbi:MAG: ribonuclease HIII [Verrucomicrobiales bacterium]|nr:ribonuclease HIII [Verrucomicrobiales bacterium]